MLLYAGNASIHSFKYSFFNDIVKKLKQWSQSAGNTYNFISGTSETIRNNTENIKNISIHVPTHLKPLNDEQFGHYLAGLIDGDGHFDNKQHLVIVFSLPDVQLAYYIKEIIGFGHVRKVKDKNAYIYVISNKEGILRTINLINNKLRTTNKYNQVITRILENSKYLNENIIFSINNSKDLNNHWLAGFSDADSSFQIKIITREIRPRPEVRLNFQIALPPTLRSRLGSCADQKHNDLLSLIKELFGGNIGYRKSKDTYYYGSTSFGSAKKVIKYFDNYHLQSSKHRSYLQWRKAYIIIQNNKHLNEEGLNTIKLLKESINKHSV
jgi:hypothetical protein